jgi:hypothetical protein
MDGGTAKDKEQRVERLQVETDRLRIVGDLALPSVGYQSRLSDTLNRAEVTFISLTNVEVSALAGGDVERRPFLLVAKAHIRIAFPVA